MNLRQAAQQALEALESKYIVNSGAWQVQRDQAITALRAALAEPQTTHWEGCEAVHPECRAKTELERKSDAIQRLWKERDELRSENRTLVRQNGEWQALNAELVGALQALADEFVRVFPVYYYAEPWAHDKNLSLRLARAALAKVEASK